MTPDQAIRTAVRHHQAGRLADAEKIYQQILTASPDHPDALHLLGVVALQTGRTDMALDLIRRAIAQNSAVAEYHMNFGIALRQKWRLDDAVAAYRESIRLKSNYPEAWNNLGNALTCQGSFDEAMAAYSEAIRLRPDYAGAFANLGHALRDQGKLDEAAAACARVVQLDPNSAGNFGNLANVLKDQGLLDEALAAYDRAIALGPGDPVHSSNRLYLLHFHPGFDAPALFAEHRKWNRLHADPLKRFIQPHTNSREPGRRLKVGYISPDFCSHPVGRFLLPLLQQHDPSAVEVFCYSDVRIPDAMTRRLQAQRACWRNIVGQSDEAVAAMIREDGIDILVDLTLHTANHRLLVFARKPAPVQITYLAYCSTSGMDAIDYRFTDPYLDPPGSDLAHYSEQTIRLPETYWCYAPGVPTQDVGPLPALATPIGPAASRGITFGCLNNFAKMSSAALVAWSRILRDVPDSRLLLHAKEGSHRRRISGAFAQQGIDPARIRFAGALPMAEYFGLYHQIDIALDPFPFAGGTTTCDALWMGVPVVTLAGRTAVSRAGASILTNAGLPEFVAHGEDDYVRIAIALADDLAALQKLRMELRERLQKSTLMDAARFARSVESAYRDVWRQWCASG